MVPVELRRRCGLDFTAPGKSFEEKVAELASAIRGEVAERKGPAVTLDFCLHPGSLPARKKVIRVRGHANAGTILRTRSEKQSA